MRCSTCRQPDVPVSDLRSTAHAPAHTHPCATTPCPFQLTPVQVLPYLLTLCAFPLLALTRRAQFRNRRANGSACPTQTARLLSMLSMPCHPSQKPLQRRNRVRLHHTCPLI